MDNTINKLNSTHYVKISSHSLPRGDGTHGLGWRLMVLKRVGCDGWKTYTGTSLAILIERAYLNEPADSDAGPDLGFEPRMHFKSIPAEDDPVSVDLERWITPDGDVCEDDGTGKAYFINGKGPYFYLNGGK